MTKNSWLVDIVLLFLAIGIFYCIGLGDRPYLAPSEARYIEIPRQMLVSGDWLTPRINGVPYFEKPPLFYWMQAITMAMFGTGEFAGRIATAKLMTLTCLLTYALARMLYGRRAGLLAAIALSTSLMGYALGRIATLDVPVSFFLTACLGAFLAAQHTQNRNWYWAMYIASALAVMSKGLIGIVLPGLIIGLWIMLTTQWRILAEARLIRGLIFFLLIAAPWHMLMAQTHPDFAGFYFIHEHVTRYLSDEHKRTAPWWFFIAVTLGGLLPWLFVIPAKAGIRSFKKMENTQLFLTLWIAVPLIFFSASHSKLIPYIFPIFPPIAILLGRILSEFWQGERPSASLRRACAGVIFLFAALLIASQLLPTLPGKLGAKLAVLHAITPTMLAPMGIALLILAFVTIKKHSAPVMISMLACFGIVTGISLNSIAAKIDPATVKPLALQIAPEAGDMVVAYHSYWQDLPVYLNRNVTVVEWNGELSFGVEHYPETHQWMIDDAEFWKRCAAETNAVYVFVREGDLKTATANASCPLREVAAYGNTVLLKKDRP